MDPRRPRGCCGGVCRTRPSTLQGAGPALGVSWALAGHQPWAVAQPTEVLSLRREGRACCCAGAVRPRKTGALGTGVQGRRGWKGLKGVQGTGWAGQKQPAEGRPCVLGKATESGKEPSIP